MIMTKLQLSVNLKVLDALRDLKSMKNDLQCLNDNVEEHGVCHYVFNVNPKTSIVYERVLKDILKKHFKTWEHYSGNSAYPITTNRKYEGGAYLSYSRGNFHTMWVEGAYAELRWKLVDHIISELEKELEEWL